MLLEERQDSTAKRQPRNQDGKRKAKALSKGEKGNSKRKQLHE